MRRPRCSLGAEVLHLHFPVKKLISLPSDQHEGRLAELAKQLERLPFLLHLRSASLLIRSCSRFWSRPTRFYRPSPKIVRSAIKDRPVPAGICARFWRRFVQNVSFKVESTESSKNIVVMSAPGHSLQMRSAPVSPQVRKWS